MLSNVPDSGYFSEDTLTMTVSIEFPGRSTFGFQASPQELDGDKIGKIIIEDAVQTKTTGIGKYITHQKEGINGSDGKSWNFKWTPLSATGDVTFYYAVNAADGDGEATGDSVYYGSYTISENPDNIPLGLQETGILQSFNVLNPVEDKIFINAYDPAQQFSVQIFDINGKFLYSSNGVFTGSAVIPSGNFVPGIYFLKIFDGQQYFRKRLVKAY